MADVTPFAELVYAIKPGATGRDIAALLDHRVSRNRALNWRAGRRGPPQWAIDLLLAQLQTRIAERSALAAQLATKVKPGLGKRYGAINLARYRVEQAKEKPGLGARLSLIRTRHA